MTTTPPACFVCHLEIPALDLAASARFYCEVFGWKVQENVPSKTYWFFDDGKVTGALVAGRRPAHDTMSFLVEVPDIEGRLERVRALGCDVIQPKGEIGGGHGFDAYVLDPSGNRIGLHQGG